VDITKIESDGERQDERELEKEVAIVMNWKCWIKLQLLKGMMKRRRLNRPIKQVLLLVQKRSPRKFLRSPKRVADML
jgi:hypothetical protein